MTLTDVLMVSATLLSPVIAVQVTRLLDERKEERGRKLAIFKTLMATRATSLAFAHVEALNRIDLEFSPRKRREKAVLEIWQQYLDHLGNTTRMEPGPWDVRRTDLLVDLLYAMGVCFGYEFSKTQIKNGTYSPTKHGRVEEEQERVRLMVLEVLEGKRAFPMKVTNFPAEAEVVQ
ncbi:DUF6680 family protein [Massilia putida]|uniref:DUF6680 family protein n=1 Tax=Massilia putida TaxID=1141883 RepID=UPI0009528FA5|nr:DUF6680 family protein [Massilia putida]